MTQVALVGDFDSTGDAKSAITGGNPTVTCNGIPIAVVGLESAETHFHGDNEYLAMPSTGSATVKIAGLPIHRVGDQRGGPPGTPGNVCATPTHVTVVTTPRAPIGVVNVFA